MTFGQHLEELRPCLFLAIFGLAIGCGIGLLPWCRFPWSTFIQKPVENALTEYYQKQAENKVAVRRTTGGIPRGRLHQRRRLQRISRDRRQAAREG